MFPLFTNPLAFWGLLALPVLAAIYWLRTRHRRYPVSSLMLWLDPQESRQGVTRIDRLRTPLLFFLELLALTLLVLAAAEPRLPLNQSIRPLIVVLDDSFSMQAGGEQSPRNQAVQALEEELKRRPRHSVRFLLAGDSTQTLGESAHTTSEALDRLHEWRGRAASSRIDETLSFAAGLGGELPLLLVLTDHAPPAEFHRGRVQWWAFGQPRPNCAIVNAVRTAHEGTERCLFEIVNYSENAAERTFFIETGSPAVEMQSTTLRLKPRETQRIIIPLKAPTRTLHARLGEDALAIDDGATLLPVEGKPVRTALRIEDKALHESIDKALRATRHFEAAETGADIVFADQIESLDDAGDAWVVQFLIERDAVSYTGPFVLDRNHPLAEGLSLQGVVWGAGKASKFAGSPVILAGDVPLLTDTETRTHSHELHLRVRPDLSTLQDAPGWPILISNLLQWRAAERPGLSRTNFRLGEQIALKFAAPREAVTITSPDGTKRKMSVRDGHFVVGADKVGVWAVEADSESTAFAVNALAANESDLAECRSGRWGDWLDETSLRLEYQSLDWVVLLLVLIIVTVHLLLVARGRGRTRQ